MGRQTKRVMELNAMCGWGAPLRQYWRECNRYDREVAAWQRAKRKAHDKHRARCRCEAYPWPHRPGGGFCRHPDPPVARWKGIKAAEIEERVAKWRAQFGEPTPAQLLELRRQNRPYRNRYVGIRRQIARANCLHPIRDRAQIDAMMPGVMSMAKQLHHEHSKYKYRNIQITDSGITGHWTTAGPTM
jgi:hypothetical protein